MCVYTIGMDWNVIKGNLVHRERKRHIHYTIFFAVYDFYFDLKHRNCYRYLISTIQYGQKFI